GAAACGRGAAAAERDARPRAGRAPGAGGDRGAVDGAAGGGGVGRVAAALAGEADAAVGAGGGGGGGGERGAVRGSGAGRRMRGGGGVGCDLGLLRGAGEGEDVADVLHAGDEEDEAFEAEAEAGVGDGAVPAQVAVPPVVLLVQAHLVEAAVEDVEAFLALRAADEFAHAGDEDVHGGDGLFSVGACLLRPVQAHVEGLDALGVVHDDDGLLEVLLGEVAFVLGLEVGAPPRLVV